MILRKTSSCLATLIIISMLSAQSITPEIMATAGDNYTLPSLQLAWTLGEIAVDNLATENQNLEQGFHQAAAGVAIATNTRSLLFQKEITFFPNPASTEIYIEIESQSSIHYTISNPLRSNLRQGELRNGQSISLRDLRPGFYWITFSLKNHLFTKPLVVI